MALEYCTITIKENGSCAKIANSDKLVAFAFCRHLNIRIRHLQWQDLKEGYSYTHWALKCILVNMTKT